MASRTQGAVDSGLSRLIESKQGRIVYIDGFRVLDYRLTEHFWRSELRVLYPKTVPLTSRFPIMLADTHLETAVWVAQHLEKIRAALNIVRVVGHGTRPRKNERTLTVTDFMRPSWLKVPKAAKRSRHNTPFLFLHQIFAADLKASRTSMDELAAAIDALIDAGEIPQGGLGIYNDHVHYDIRGTKVRWDSR